MLQGEQSVGYDMEGSDFELGWKISRIQPSRGERKKVERQVSTTRQGNLFPSKRCNLVQAIFLYFLLSKIIIYFKINVLCSYKN